ncbi:MAG: hypothetical protein EDM78_12435 [Proteobacteria bacterium]|nr:MAG: hypothetical protein EDM78_12435 [Pseudomonadota bacterium]
MTSMHEIVRRLAMGGEPPVLREDTVFIKTRIGRDEARRTAIHSYRGLDDALDMLRKMGFVEPLPERWDLG